jgi:adenylate cyclase
VDDLLWGLNSNGSYTIGYADDFAILINGKFLQTVSEVLQTTLGTVQQWCERTKLSVNSNKMVVIPFTRKRTIKGLKELILFNKIIQLSSEVKYLVVTLDKGLTWKNQLDKIISKAYKAF